MNIKTSHSKPRKASLHATITRANGKVENVGVVAYYHWFAPWRVFVNALIAIKRLWR